MLKTAVTTVVLLSLFFSFLLISPSTADIKSITIDSDTRPMILCERFGFTRTGHLSIFVSSVSVLSQHQQPPPPDPSRLGFFLATEQSFFQAPLDNNNIHQTPNPCILDSPYAITLHDFRQLSPHPSSSFNTSFPLPSPNEYFLGFANCALNTSVSMKVRTEMYNLDSNGSKDFLSAGDTQLPTIFFFFALSYFLFLATWIYICKKHRFSLHIIHKLMGTLLVMKAINLMCAAEDMHFVKFTGTPQPFSMSKLIRAVLLFTVIDLIGTGWSFLKPFLKEREEKVLMVVVLLQVLPNVAPVVMDEMGPLFKDWDTLNYRVFLLVDVICCCAAMFAIVWSVRTLRETSKTDGQAARNLVKLRLFRRFYVAIIGYLCFTRIVVSALQTIAAYQYQWASNFTGEAASLVFYVVVFYMFRPAKRNEYFVVDGDEEEAAEKELRDEEFEL